MPIPPEARLTIPNSEYPTIEEWANHRAPWFPEIRAVHYFDSATIWSPQSFTPIDDHNILFKKYFDWTAVQVFLALSCSTTTNTNALWQTYAIVGGDISSIVPGLRGTVTGGHRIACGLTEAANQHKFFCGWAELDDLKAGQHYIRPYMRGNRNMNFDEGDRVEMIVKEAPRFRGSGETWQQR